MLQLSFACVAILFIFVSNASKLWVRENIGEVTHWFFNQRSTVAYVSTKQDVIASLDLTNNGTIIWRQILDKADHINRLTPTFDSKSLISLSNGNVLRKWRASDGVLLWETRQFTKPTATANPNNADMKLLPNRKIILIDNLDTLTVYDEDEGTLIWKQPIHSANKLADNYRHKLYIDEASKIVYIITFYAESVLIESYSMSTGELLETGNTYRHECAGLPASFEVLPSSPSEDASLMVFYDCSPNAVTPLYAFLFSITSSSDLQITPLSVSFDNANPSLRNWQLIGDTDSLALLADYCQKYEVNIVRVGASQSVSLVTSTNQCVLPLNTNADVQSRGQVKRMWTAVDGSSKGILTDDGSLCYVVSSNEVSWCREEALSSPLFVYLFDESEEESSLCAEDMNEEECEAAYHAPFPSFPVRLANDMMSLFTISGVAVHELTRKLNTFFPITSAWLDVTFEKTMTILTRSGKLYGLSSTNGDILWSIHLKQLCGTAKEVEIVNMLSIRQHPPHLLAILRDNGSVNGSDARSWIISISSPFHIIGQKPHIHIETVDYWIEKAFGTPWLTKEHSDKIALLITRDNEIKSYPFQEDIASNSAKIFYHTLSQREETLSGYHLKANKGNDGGISSASIWSKSFRNTDEEIVDFVFSSHDQLVVNSVYRTGERGAIYKYLNPHLLGVATVNTEQNVLHIYLMDGVTGRIYLHQYHGNVEKESGQISMLLYENKFVYSFFNAQTLLTEITSIDLWLSDPAQVPTKARTPSEGYIVGENPLDNNVFSSFNAPLPYFTFQAYNFGLSIEKLLCVSSTRYSVSNKWILATLSSGSVIQIDSKWLNTRRPMKHDPTQANKEEQLIPYKRNIPFNNLWTLSHANTLRRISKGISIGSPIESTSSIFAYGELDLFYSLFNPSRNFDTIPPDFDYPMLALILSGVTAAIFVARYLVQSKKIKKEWK